MNASAGSGKLTQPGPGRWIRGRGVVAGGYVRLVVAEGLEEYDLEEAALRAASRKKAVTPWDELRRLDVESETEVAGFVSRWGLLGLAQEERWVRSVLAERGNVARRCYPLCPEPDEESCQTLRTRVEDRGLAHLFSVEEPSQSDGGGAPSPAEPLCLFRMAVCEFQSTARSAARWSEQPVTPPFPRLERSLREHTLAVRPELLFRPGAWGEYEACWSLAYPSLLVACYDKLRVQLAGGVLRYCPVCWRTFAATSDRQIYCPEGCKNAAKCRRRRDRERGAA